MSATTSPPAEPRHDLTLPFGAEGADLYATWKSIPGELTRLALERARAELAATEAATARTKRAEEAFAQGVTEADERLQRETAEITSLTSSLRTRANKKFQADTAAAQDEHQTKRKTATTRHRKEHHDAQTTHEAGRWEHGTLYETAEKGASEARAEAKGKLSRATSTLKDLREQTVDLQSLYRGFLGKVPAIPNLEPQAEGADPFEPLAEAMEQAEAELRRFEAASLPRMFHGFRIAWAFVLPLLLLVPPAVYVLGSTVGGAAGAVVGLAIGFGLFRLIKSRGRAQAVPLEVAILTTLDRADALQARCEPFYQDAHRTRVEQAKTRRDAALKRIDQERDAKIATADSAREVKVREADSTASAKLSEYTEVRDKILGEAAATDSRRRAEITAQHEADTRSVREIHRQSIQDVQARHQSDRARIAQTWKSGIDAINHAVSTVRGEIDRRFPAWDAAGSVDWKPAPGLPPAVRLGEIQIPLQEIRGGISRDPELRAMAPDQYIVPALVEFPEKSSLVIEFRGDEGRQRATEAMQGLMLRFLTGLPPGKVRFTIFDPIGLGRGFAGFMHLADYSEAMVGGRIWTEPQQIEMKLSEINLHIETVIQSYLRNEYPTIEAYNDTAGEVAEPYRILVVADFPAGFTEASARRLAAIAKSGPRCGVYVILGMDVGQPKIPNLEDVDFAPGALRISWANGRFLLRDKEYEAFPFTIDAPPPVDEFTKLVHRAGEAARAANRVEVPFEVIAPSPENYWKGDTASGLSVPLGRSGATKLQNLSLGKGTSQHVLTAGRTGSGKSTLLHALITNAALIYSPDQIEMYLIDFKKGVEFKTYATQGLPHARVVAIESEREFGLSVLQRLDAELKVRGDRFRDLGVQDLAGYRRQPGEPPLPRVMLIVDEFQEFFIEDDKLAQEASLLFDRLVRQGRAFGIHVVLGSQTLSGAYSLARSTLGQMAVRIALQCSEADAQLILNEDNSAAKLLSRPGEAIYNDANGQSDANHHFQVVWLPDRNREAYLRTIAELSKSRGYQARPRIVFEGNQPSDLSKHPAMNGPRLASIATPIRAPKAWLGEAVAIKDPTAASFRSQGGSNLLVIGQNDEMAAGFLASAVLGLAAQLGLESTIDVVDGTPEDSPTVDSFAKLAPAIPLPYQVVGPRDVGKVLGEAAAEIERRQGGGDAPPRFVVIFDLPRFRDLRKQEDDFSFSRKGKDEPVSPAKLLGTVLREGPPLGIFTIVWCDSLNNANRAFDRQALREFEMRVLFQMSAADSSNLIDSPAANRLGPNRALFASEEQGVLEKFRPYGMPTSGFLDDIRDRWQVAPPATEPNA